MIGLGVLLVAFLALVVWLSHMLGRARRELAIALLRCEKEPLLGRQIVALSGGALPPRVVYLVLHHLETERLVLSDPCLGDPWGRRIFTASERAAELHRNRLTLDVGRALKSEES